MEEQKQLDEKEIELYSQARKMALDSIFDEFRIYLTDVYFRLFSTGDEIADFMFQMSKVSGDYDAIVHRTHIVKQMIRHNEKLLYELSNNNRDFVNKLKKEIKKPARSKYSVIYDVDDTKMLAAFHSVYDGRIDNRHKQLFELFDFAGLTKIGVFADNAKDILKKIKAKYKKIEDVDIEQWKEMCIQLKSYRNEFDGHKTTHIYKELSDEKTKRIIDYFVECSGKFVCEENKKSFEKFQYNASLLKQQLDFDCVLIEDLTSTGYNCETISLIMNTEYGHLCNEKYVLIETKEKALQQLSNYKKNVEGIDLDIFASKMCVPVQLVIDSLPKSIELKDNKVFEISESLLTTIFMNANQSLYDDLNHLSEYKSGNLSENQIFDLLRTHELFLDNSILLNENGRKYINNVLLPYINELNKNGQPIHLYIEATTKAYIEKMRADYKTSKEAEKKEYDSCYIWINDFLYTTYNYVVYKGIPSRIYDMNESMAHYVRDNKNRRICVLTWGKNEIANMINKEESPFCVVARAMNSIGNKQKYDVRIFPKHLPFIESIRNVSLNILESKDTKKYNRIQAVDKDASFVKQSKDISFRKMSEERIVLDNPIPEICTLSMETEEKIVVKAWFDENGQKKEGGEGKLYEIDENYVAKLYHTEETNYKLTTGRRDKIEEMIKNVPRMKRICWPQHALYFDNQFVGYVMEKVPEHCINFSKSVLQINKLAVQQEVLKGWDRLDLVKCAKALASCIEQLHANDILMGDINPDNFMCDPRNSETVYLVDCDSYQYSGFPCPVGTVDYTHPHIIEREGNVGGVRFDSFLRTEEEEDFVLAMFIFQILFLNEYPFTVKGMQPSQAIRERKFPYIREEAKDVPDGDNWMIWKNLPSQISSAFIDVFRHWKHVRASEWVKYLKTYQYMIEQKGFSRELTPKKYHEFNPNNPRFVDVNCDICGMEFNLLKDKYERLNQYKQKKLCRNCYSFVENLKNSPIQLQCQNCLSEFDSNCKVDYFNKKFGDKVICSDCELIVKNCSLCGAPCRKRRIEFKKLADENKVILCKKCRGW